MKLGIVHGLTLILLLFSSLACVQGPMDLSAIVQQDFPQLTSSSPSGSNVGMYDEDAARLFSITITNTSTEGFRTQWTLNGIVEHGSSNQLTYSFDPNAANTGLGNHTLVATVFSSDGSKVLGSRTWYVTVSSTIALTNRYPEASDELMMIDELAIDSGGISINGVTYPGSNPSPFAVMVNKSLIDGETRAYVSFFHKTDTSFACTDENNASCALSVIPGADKLALTANTYRSLSDNFSINIPDDGEIETRQIVAKIYKKEPAPSTVYQQVGSPIIWWVKVRPVNQRPKIAFTDDAVSSSKNITVTQGTASRFRISASDYETATASLRATYQFSKDAGATWTTLLGTAPTIDDPTSTGSCSNALISECQITFPSYYLDGVNPRPLDPRSYQIRASVSDGSLSSRYITWTVGTTEAQSLPTVTASSAATIEGNNATIDFSVTDQQYDQYCIEVLRATDGQAQMIVSDVTAGTSPNTLKYCPADAGVDLYPAIGSSTRQIAIRLPYDTVSANGTVNYTLRITEVLSVATAASTSVNRSFSIAVTNNNPVPTVGGAPTPALAGTQFDVVTGTSFVIKPGTFSDASAADGIENKFYYRWQVATDAANCSALPAASYQDITGASNEGSTPIALTAAATTYAQMDLYWTPPHSIAGQQVCFKFCYRDDAMANDCANNLTWIGTTGLVLARSNTVDHTAQITDMVKMVSTTDTSVIPAITYHVVAESAAVGTYKIVSTTHTEKANSNSAILLAAHTPALATEIKDLSVYRSPAGKFYIASLVNDGINADHNLVYISVHANTGAHEVDFLLSSYARSMGKIMFDGTNWFIPYVESTNRRVVFATGTDIAKGAEAAISEFGMTNASIENIFTSVPHAISYLVVKRDDAQSSLYSFDLQNLIFVSADYSLLADNIFNGENISSPRFLQTLSDVDGDDDLYLLAINNDQSGKLAMAKLDLASPAAVLQDNLLPMNGTDYPSSLSNILAIDVKATSSQDTLYITLLNQNKGIYQTKLAIGDNLLDDWKLDGTKTSYRINPTGANVSGSFFTASLIIEDYALSTTSSGTDDDGDTQFFFYSIDNAGTPNVYSSLVNTEEVVITPLNEDLAGWHPGFFKAP